MLESKALSTPLFWDPQFQQIDFERDTLIIPNLRTKKEIQNQILQRQSYFESLSVLRVSDFWKTMALRCFPTYQVVSSDLAFFVIKKQARLAKEDFIRNASIRTLYQMLVQMGPLYLKAESTELWEEWLAENEKMKSGLEIWRGFLQSMVQDFLKQKKILLEWVPYLLHEDLKFEKKWDRPLWIDLGSELSRAEAQVFQTMSSSLPVRIFYPETKWTPSFSYLLQPYDFVTKSKTEISESTGPGPLTAMKFSSRLSEIKNAVAQVRSWVDQKIPLDQIAILSPQIEKYWPILSSYLEVEGIPTQKRIVSNLSSRWPVLQWLSKLQTLTKSLQSMDYEMQFYNPFDKENQLVIGYEDFLVFFKNLYDEQDLQRWKKLPQLIQTRYQENDLLRRDEFLLYSFQSWSFTDQTEDLETIYREVLQVVDENFSLSLKDWIEWVEKIASAKEKVLLEASSHGLEIGSLMSDHSLKISHRLLLGLCEEDFTTSSLSFVSADLRTQLSKDLGFDLEDPEQNFKHFQIRWVLERKVEQTILSVGLTDFDGALLTPLSLWYQYQGLQDFETQVHQSPRWDLLQKQALETVLLKEKNMDLYRAQRLQLRLLQDDGQAPEDESQIKVESLSPSRVENFLKCPFTFKAQKVYRLSAPPEIDIDMDPRSKGMFTHRLLEALIQDKIDLSWSSSEIESLIEKIREEKQIDYFHDELWKVQKRRYLRLAKNFVQFETQWRKKYPSLKSIHSEVKWSFGYDPKTAEFVKIESDSQKFLVRLNGQIDRADISRDSQVSLIDYKSSLPAVTSFSKWIEKNNLQLLFYAWVIQNGFVDGIQGELVAANYYNIKDFTRDHGFQSEEAKSDFLPVDVRKSQKITEEQRQNLFQEFELKLKEVLFQIGSKTLSADPSDVKDCPRCDWKKLCRAKHLN